VDKFSKPLQSLINEGIIDAKNNASGINSGWFADWMRRENAKV
jgi:hypothetical protein